MKKLVSLSLIASLALGGMTFYSCSSGTGESEPIPGKIESIEIQLDKTVIEANDEDKATITIIANTGVDVTSSATIYVDGVLLRPRVNEVTAFQDGQMQIIARYTGAKGDTVILTAQNRKNYEKYYRHVVMMENTGTWCSACPPFSKVLKEVIKQHPGRMNLIAMHGGNDPFTIPETDMLLGRFGLSTYPNGVMDLRVTFPQRGVSDVVNAIKESLHKYPATLGIALASTYNEGSGDVNLTIKITSIKDETPKLGIMVMEDGLVASQSNGSPYEVHNHVARKFFTNVMGNPIEGTLVANQERTINLKTNITELNVQDINKAQFVVYVTTDDNVINNSAVCNVVNGSFEYKLN